MNFFEDKGGEIRGQAKNLIFLCDSPNTSFHSASA
jgi:hypothetical protein